MSQADKMLKVLADNTGIWCGMPLLCEMGGSLNCHSRIADLRKRGIIIENRVERQPDGTNKSWYRIPQSTEWLTENLNCIRYYA